MRRWRRNCSGPLRRTTPTWEMRTRAEALGPGDAARIDLALLLLRVILAAVFGSYGYLKWAGGLGRPAGLMLTLHLPVPVPPAPLVAALGVGRAVLLLIG